MNAAQHEAVRRLSDMEGASIFRSEVESEAERLSFFGGYSSSIPTGTGTATVEWLLFVEGTEAHVLSLCVEDGLAASWEALGTVDAGSVVAQAQATIEALYR